MSKGKPRMYEEAKTAKLYLNLTPTAVDLLKKRLNR